MAERETAGAQVEGTRQRRGSYEEDQAELLARLRRIEGQVRGLQRMVEELRYCPDVLTQVAATRAALAQVGLILLRSHTEHCVAEAVRRGDDPEPIDDLIRVFERFAG